MSLSKSQRMLLKSLLLERANLKSHSRNTFKALQKKELLNGEDVLTKKGFLKSLELISLEQQCKFLSLNLDIKTFKSLDFPEFQAYKWFKSQGFVGTFCEGGAILTVLKALTLDKLTELNSFNSREDACTRFLEAQFTILKNHKNDLLNSISKTSETRFLHNFSEIINFESIKEYYPGLSIEFAKHFARSLDREVFSKIADKFFQSPYDYRKGWPDLTLINENQVKFVEIKTTDKLHHSQIRIIDKFSPLIPAKFEVLKLTK